VITLVLCGLMGLDWQPFHEVRPAALEWALFREDLDYLSGFDAAIAGRQGTLILAGPHDAATIEQCRSIAKAERRIFIVESTLKVFSRGMHRQRYVSQRGDIPADLAIETTQSGGRYWRVVGTSSNGDAPARAIWVECDVHGRQINEAAK